MHKIAVPVILAALLCACAVDAIPKGYSGPVAHITDTMTKRDNGGVDFFYLSKIDGRMIQNSLRATTEANYGQGFSMTPQIVERDVPAEQSTYTIEGRTHYAAPIIEIFSKVYELTGETQFSPQPNHSYLVKGVLGDDYSAVWVEDSATGELMGQKVELKGSSKLGPLQK